MSLLSACMGGEMTYPSVYKYRGTAQATLDPRQPKETLQCLGRNRKSEREIASPERRFE